MYLLTIRITSRCFNPAISKVTCSHRRHGPWAHRAPAPDTSSLSPQFPENQSNEFGGYCATQVDVSDGGRHAGNLGIVEACRKNVLLFGHESTGLRVLAFVSRPHLFDVMLRNEHYDIAGPLLVDSRQ